MEVLITLTHIITMWQVGQGSSTGSRSRWAVTRAEPSHLPQKQDRGHSLWVSLDQSSVPGMAWESSLHLWGISVHHSLPQSRSGVPAEGYSSVPACYSLHSTSAQKPLVAAVACGL